MMNRKFGGGNAGPGLLGAAPAQLDQRFGSSGGMVTSQMGMGGRSQMGGGTQMRGGSQLAGSSQMRGNALMGGGVAQHRNVQQSGRLGQERSIQAANVMRTDSWPQSENRRRALLGDPPVLEDSSQEVLPESEYVEEDYTSYGYNKQEVWPESGHEEVGYDSQEVWPESEYERDGYTNQEVWPDAGNASAYAGDAQTAWGGSETKGRGLLGDAPSYENEMQESRLFREEQEHYGDAQLRSSRPRSLMEQVPFKNVKEAITTNASSKRGMALLDTPSPYPDNRADAVYREELQFSGDRHPQKPVTQRQTRSQELGQRRHPAAAGNIGNEPWSSAANRGKALLADPTSYVEEVPETMYRGEQDVSGDRQARDMHQRPIKSQRQTGSQRLGQRGHPSSSSIQNDPWSNTAKRGRALLDDPVSHVEEMHETWNSGEEEMSDMGGMISMNQRSENTLSRMSGMGQVRDGLLGNQMGQSQQYRAGSQVGIESQLGSQMGQGQQYRAGSQMGMENQLGNQMGQRQQYRTDSHMGMESQLGNQMGQSQQYRTGSQVGMESQLRTRNQMNMGAQMRQANQMGMDSQMRSGMQMGSDRYLDDEIERGFNENRTGSGMGLLGSGPREGQLQNSGLIHERQSAVQQSRGVLGPPSLLDNNRLSQQERAIVQQHQDRRMMQQRENQLRATNLMKQQQQQQIQQPLQSQPIMKQRMQSGLMGKGDGLLGEGPKAPLFSSANRNLVAGRAGNIPSLLDTPSTRLQGKRQGERINRPGDKKLRPALSPDKRRDNRRDDQDRRQQTRGSGSRQSRLDQSSSHKKERKESDSKRSESSRKDDKHDSRDGKRSRDTSAKSSKTDLRSERTVNTQILVTFEGDSGKDNDQYDPANPTADDEDMDTADELKMDEAEVLEMINNDDDDEVMFVMEEKTQDTTKVNKSKDDESKSEKSETVDLTAEDSAKDEKPKDSNLTVTVTKHKKGRSVNDAEGTAKQEEKKKYHCNVCNVYCFSEVSFSNHMKGQKHTMMMKSVMKVTEERSAQIAARLKAESHLRKIEGASGISMGRKEPPGKALESHCKTCDKKFTGAYRDHKETPEHKDRESLRRAGCKICSISSFSNFNNYTTHLQSDMHSKNSFPHCNLCNQWFKSPRKFVQHCKTDHHLKNKQKRKKGEDEGMDYDEMSELVTLDVIGFEDETAQDKDEEMDVTRPNEKGESTTMNLEPLTPMLSKAQATSTPKPAGTESITSQEKIVIPDEYDPDTAVGQDYVIAVSGYFCKLCHKFYNNETAAKKTHCQSIPHFEKYKTAMVSKAYNRRLKEEATGQKATESKTVSQSPSTSKNIDQSNVTEGSNYETADEQQDSTIQKSTHDSLQRADKQLPNGNTDDHSQEENSQEEDSKNDSENLSQDDDEKAEKTVGRGRGLVGVRGQRNKARRAKRF